MMILVFPIGGPFAVWLLLFNNRFAIEGRIERTGGPELDTFAFLFRNYAPGEAAVVTVTLVELLLHVASNLCSLP